MQAWYYHAVAILSVCLSVTRIICVRMHKYIVKLFHFC